MRPTEPPTRPLAEDATVETDPAASDTAVGEERDGGHWWRGQGRARRRRSIRAAAILMVLVAVAAGGYLVGRGVADRSEEAEDRRRPPQLTALTEAVVEARIAPTVSGPGRLSAGELTAIDCLPTVEGDARPAFTVAPVGPGTEVTEGTVLAEVNDRPVIVLAGDVPTYRDLRPDARGRAVTQLQEALARLGLGDGTIDGHYGPATWDAVRALYESRGYAPVEPTSEQIAALEGAEAEVAEAVARANAAVTQEEYDRARADRDAARDRLAALRATTGPVVPYCEIVFVAHLPALAGSPEAEARPAGPTPTAAATAPADPSAPAPGTPWLTLGRGEPTAELVVSAEAARTITPGLDAAFTSSTGTGELHGTVRQVHPGPPAIAAVSFPEADAAIGEVSGTVTVTLPAPDEPVLAVSVAAPIRAANGATTVVRVGPDGRRQTIRVETGASDGALVEVVSSEPALRPGDELLIGVRGE